MTVVFRSVALLMAGLLLPLPSAARTRKGDKLVKEGQKAYAAGDTEQALVLFEQALITDYAETEYQLLARKTRSVVGQQRVIAGQRLRNAGKLEDALVEFQRAFAVDPSSSLAETEARKTYEMIQRERNTGTTPPPQERGMTPADIARRDIDERMASLRQVPELKPLNPQITNLKMNNQNARVMFETVAKLAGINVIFDPDFISQAGARTYTLDLTNSTIEDALDYVSLLTKAFWKPISTNAIFVTQDQVTKRRDFEDNVVRVFYLQNTTAQQELNEIAAALRAVTEIRRLLTYTAQMAIMVRGTSDQVALAEKLILDLDKPKAEVVVDVLVMEANRARTRDLVATITSGGIPGINLPISYTGGGESGSLPLGRLGNLSHNDFSVAVPGALVKALLNDRTTRVLQNPQLRTLDTIKASLKIGDRYPYATGSFQPGIGVGGGGVSPLVSTQFQFAEIGVNVDVQPKVHANGEITMHIEVEVSNIADRIVLGGLEQPVIGQRKVIEDVRLREGESSVLGGLTGLIKSRTSQGIPGLATLPGIGWLFGAQNVQTNENELLVVMTPRIVRNPDLTEVNLRTISAGNDQVVKLSREPRRDSAAPPATTPAAQPPVTVPPAATAPPAPPLAPSPAPAAPTMILQFTPGAMAVKSGERVTATLEARGAVDLFSASLRVNYDTTRLRLVEIARGEMLGGPAQPVSFIRDVNTGMVRLARLEGASGATGEGVLVTLTFEALAPGVVDVAVEDAAPVDSRQQPLPFRALPLKITVE
jgi:general secretion pathway protein D